MSDRAKLADMIGHCIPLVRPIKDYGKTWRCWAEKPTKEERKAAEWYD